MANFQFSSEKKLKFNCWLIVFIFSKAEEEVRTLQKKIQQIENELDQAQEGLLQANSNLDEKDKALQTVSKNP